MSKAFVKESPRRARTAFARLRAAVALEDDLPYDEPWGWMQPVRHALGALLLEQGRAAEAEVVYREDLGLGWGTARRANPPRQPVDPARAARLSQAARRACGGRASPPARGPRRRPRRSAMLHPGCLTSMSVSWCSGSAP